MNPNLAEYHIPVNADVPSLEAILVEERDPHVNALGIKGVGEIGITARPVRRQRGLACDRSPGAQLSDHARPPDHSRERDPFRLNWVGLPSGRRPRNVFEPRVGCARRALSMIV